MDGTASLSRLIGANIRRERLRQNLTQEQLSEKVAKTAQYLSLIENGDRCGSVGTYSVIAEELNVPIGELFQTDEQSNLSLFCDCSRYEIHVLKATLRAMRDALGQDPPFF